MRSVFDMLGWSGDYNLKPKLQKIRLQVLLDESLGGIPLRLGDSWVGMLHPWKTVYHDGSATATIWTV